MSLVTGFDQGKGVLGGDKEIYKYYIYKHPCRWHVCNTRMENPISEGNWDFIRLIRQFVR